MPDLDLARDAGRHLLAEVGAEPAEAHALRLREGGGGEVAEREQLLPGGFLDLRLRPGLVDEAEGAALVGRDELPGTDEVGGDEVPRDETKELVAVVGIRNAEADLGLPEEDAAGRRVAVVAGEEEGEAGTGGVSRIPRTTPTTGSGDSRRARMSRPSSRNISRIPVRD